MILVFSVCYFVSACGKNNEAAISRERGMSRITKNSIYRHVINRCGQNLRKQCGYLKLRDKPRKFKPSIYFCFMMIWNEMPKED